MQIDKKIQFGGYCKNNYKIIRTKVNRFLDEDQKNLPYREPRRKRNYKCNKNKGEHTFVKLEKPYNYIYTERCSACGKLHYDYTL